MLGEEFQLESDAIQEVLNRCGCNMQKFTLFRCLLAYEDEEEEKDSFQFFQRAVKEYRATMKEYYKAVVDVFAKGDQDQANKILE
ncbi:hypothetical protein PVK06_025409 [Gossypium arboreum]|uniref:Uncharacterized protein n=1 Tax=Gossypium arboreum TaxID=29729 RepID=A0ABR0PGT8_GOSAR|nr:hypothetical protein PVK06_025409 [Gossypium arboreum]